MVIEENEIDAAARSAAPRPPVHRRPVAIGLVVLGLLLVIMLFRHLHKPADATLPHGRGTGRQGQNGPVAVTVAPAVAGEVSLRIPALGTITPLATVTVKTQISGQLQKIAFQEGQLVKAGDFLAQIDPRPYQAALEQAKGNLRRDQALLADARLDLKRFEELIKEDSVAQQQLDTQRALVDQYGGTVESDEAQVRPRRSICSTPTSSRR